MLQQMQQGQRRFPLPEVLADCFPERLAVCDVIQGIVGDLKGDAEVLAEAEQRRLLRFLNLGQNGPHAAGRGNQTSGLVLDDLDIIDLRHRGVPVIV